MARPPIPTSEQRRAEAAAAAESAARAAGQTNAQESRRLTDRLLAGGAEARFDALSRGDFLLTQADRRRLLSSLAGKEPPRRVVPGGTASRWALIRSRLPYRVDAVAFAGVMATVLLTGILLARANTPLGIVVSNASQDLSVFFTLKDGQVAFDRLEANKSYVYAREEGDVAVLRRWVPGAGYAEARVPVVSMHWAPAGVATPPAGGPPAGW